MRENNDTQFYKDMGFRIAPVGNAVRKFYIFLKERQIKYLKELFTSVVDERARFVNSLGFSEHTCINVSFEDKGGVSVEFMIMNDDLNYESAVAQAYSAIDLILDFMIDKNRNQDTRASNIMKRVARGVIPLAETTLGYMKDIKLQSRLITKGDEEISNKIDSVISLLGEINDNFKELGNG